jgi:hypothetical protein
MAPGGRAALRDQVTTTYGRVVRRFNCFHGTSAEQKVAKDLFIQAVNFIARKP